MDKTVYLNAAEILNGCNNYAVVSSLGIKAKKKKIDVIRLIPSFSGGAFFVFYNGNPDISDNWEELELTGEEQEQVLSKFVSEF